MKGYEEEIIYSAESPFSIQFSEHPEQMNAHWHPQIELMFFYETDGCEYICRDKRLSVRKNDLIIANSAEVHECRDFASSSVCCIVAETAMLSEFAGLKFENLVRGDEAITDIFKRLKGYRKSPAFKLAAKGCIYEIFSVLAEKHSDFQKTAPLKQNTDAMRKTVTDILIYIQENLSEVLRAEVLAERAHMSVGRFQHIFKEVAGVSPAEYTEKMRIARAKELLTGGSCDISEIAFKCGFSEHSYFSKRFKKYTGVTPTAYKTAEREKLTVDKHILYDTI